MQSVLLVFTFAVYVYSHSDHEFGSLIYIVFVPSLKEG